MLPNEVFSDGTQDIYGLQFLDIELVAGAGDCGTEAEVEAMLPYIKGDPFTYEDFTPEQIEGLQRPATEAAIEALRAADRAETEADAATAAAERAETAADSMREIEVAVTDAESKREKAETDRVEAEEERKDAETKRAEEFAEWETEIDSKADKAELSNVLAEEPLTPDNFPDIDALTREELKMDLFIDMWNSACGQYGKYAPEAAADAEHPFLLNGLWLTYEEAINVYYEPLQQPNDYSYKYARKLGMRTNICTFSSAYYETISAKGIAFGNNTLETIRLSSNTQGFWSNNYSSAFRSCPKLKTILPIIYDSYLSKTIWDRAFEGSPLLEHVLISELRSSVSFSQCPKLSLDSLTHLVANAANTAAITITVHPDVYAKLTDETNTEWHALLAQAAEKNINFATT